MLKFLKDVVAGSVAGVKDLPYTIGEPYSSAWGSWTHSHGISKVDGSPVSIFSLSGSNDNDGRLAAGRNGIKRLRTVRHPNILSFLHSAEAEIIDGSYTKVTIYIVTEPVMPLAEKIKELGLQGTQRDEYYAWGLQQIAKAVSFLNNDCKLVHGNVCLESVVVTQTLDWKLHAFDVLSEFDGNNEAASGPMLVRHPNILSFLHSAEAEIIDGSYTKVTIYIVTEPVMPLAEKIKELGLQGTQRDEYYAWGLQQIAKAVSFLNNDCKLVHGNVCLESVVVTQTLDWKLHAFDVLSEFDGNNEAASGPMLQYDWLVGTQYKPVELAKSDWTAIRKSPPWAIDSWGLGCLIYEIFSGLKLSKTEELRNTASLPKSLLPDYQRLLSSTPSRRLNSSKLVENCEYFQNKLVETIHFMEILNLKDSVEKDTFFRKLPTLAEQLPREIVLKKLLPLLGSALEFGSAAAPALTPFLKIGAWLSAEEFSIKVLPTLVKLFASNDRAIRVGLLQHISEYGESFTSQVVEEQVYPQIATGFSDTSAFLRELTLKSMLVLVPKLSQRTTSGSLLKYLSKLQVDEEPAIRTNTTILLGNLASHLNEGTRKRVLINAFTIRALRDTFPPARGAGIMALCATSSYYSALEIAARILPNVVVLVIDPDSDVRSKAFQAVEQFLQIVKQYHEKTNARDNVEPTSSRNSSSSLPGNASILGWAMSSLSIKGKPSEHTPHLSASSSAPNISAVINASSVVSDAPSRTLVRASSTADIVDQPAPVLSPTSTEGWGELENGINDDQENEKDGWDDFMPLEDPKQSQALASIQAAQKRPVTQTPKVSNMRAKSTTDLGKSEDNELWGFPPKAVASKKPSDDDDPWAAIAAPLPTTRAKPLGAGGRGRGRGSRPALPKLGAQKINRTSSTGS